MFLELPPQVAAAPAEPALSPDLEATLRLAAEEGDEATVLRLFALAGKARPQAVTALEKLRAEFAAKKVARANETAAETRARLASRNLFANWTGQVELGASRTAGTATSFGLAGAMDIERKGITWSHRTIVRGELQETNGERGVERLSASWEPRRKLGETAYLFGLAQYEHDPFLGYDTRWSGGLGAGLRLGSPDRMTVAVEGGPAIRRTESTLSSRTSLAGRGSADLSWPVTDRLTFQQRGSAFYEDGHANGQVLTAIDTRVSSKVKLRLSHEYRYEKGTQGSASRASVVFGL